MDREEVLSLLRERLADPEIVSLLERRHPEIQPALDLVPLALTLLAEQDNDAARVAAIIPTMSEECRTLLRLCIQGLSFDQISEEMDIDAAGAYARCRGHLFPSSKPLTEYAAGILSEEERLALLARALRDSAIFRSLRDEHALVTLLENSDSRAKLLEATEEVRFTIHGSLREWFDRPRSKVLVLLGAVALASILVQECGGRR